MATRRRNALAEAHQANRDLRNTIHRLEQDQLPARTEAADWKRRYDALQAQVTRLTEERDAFGDAAVAQARLLSLLATGKE